MVIPNWYNLPHESNFSDPRAVEDQLALEIWKNTRLERSGVKQRSVYGVT